MYQCSELKAYSQPGETEGDFRISLRQQAQEERDLRVEKLRSKYASKTATCKLDSMAEAAVDREKSQATRATLDSAISFGSTLLGAIFGRKLASRAECFTKASTSMRSTVAICSSGATSPERKKVTSYKETTCRTGRGIRTGS
ncbi:MAG: hypothetical protein R3C11_16760 [Planctomycetaceae bacterium]